MAKRRSNGTGSLKKRDNGTWQISIMVAESRTGREISSISLEKPRPKPGKR